MVFVRRFLPLVLLLSGCAGPDGGPAMLEWQWPFHTGKQQIEADAVHRGSYRQFSFDWALSGDPQVMPVQVFDDGTRMWLQFAPDSVWPAVFEVASAGMRPLVYRREEPYLVLDAIHDHLELRGGHLRGTVRRVRPEAGSPAVQASAIALPDAKDVAAPLSLPSTLPEAPSIPGTGPLAVRRVSDSGAAQGAKLEAVARDVAVPLPAMVEKSPSYLGKPLLRFAVSPSDQTMRQALERWAQQTGWAFSAEHWAVDVDIPLVGEATFSTDFKSAVRELLEATEMGDRPLQPCFYSNRVLRVVPYAQPCDRWGASRAAS